MNRLGKLVLSALRALFITDWQDKLRTVLTGIVVWQFIEWFDEYWLSATTWLARGAVITVIVIGFFPRVHVIWRYLVGFVILVGLHLYRLGITLQPIPDDLGWQTYLFELWNNAWLAMQAMTPYFWFALGTAIIHLAAAQWLKERARIMVAIVLSVIVFALVDSYSKYVMWDQVAYIIFSGLGLIIIEHYDHFRRKHPSSWEYLTEYPARVAVPIVLIISFIMLAGALAPNAKPLLTDPYTLYKHWKGERVVTGGKSFPSDTSNRFLPTWNTSSGYGRDDSMLGEGFDYDFSEVMRVRTSHRSYWRGETKSFYTGEGWAFGEADVSHPLEPVMVGEDLPEYDWGFEKSSEAKTVDVEQTFYLTAEERVDYPVLFGAYPIKSFGIASMNDPSGISSPGSNQEQNLHSTEPDEERKTNQVLLFNAAWSSKQGELRWGDSLPYPNIYEVVSTVPVTDEEAWRSIPQQSFENELFAPYLQLPDTLPTRVRDLAEEITADAKTPYDKVKSIEAYLQTTFKYTNRPDLSKGRSEDFVDRFLFEIQEGYCDYYSSAMAVMVRSLGLPARWVKGFKPGIHELLLMSPGADGVLEQVIRNLPSDAEGTYVVRNSDAHSWVEVFFPGYGWLPFEPTAGHSLPILNSDGEVEEVMAGLSIDSLTGEKEEGVFGGSLFTVSVLGYAAGILLFSALVFAAWRFGWYRKLRFFLSRSKAERNLNQQVLIEIGRIFNLFKRNGYPRGAHETARESFARWSEQNMWLKKDLDRLLAILERAKYSPYGVTADDYAAVLTTRKRIKEELK